MIKRLAQVGLIARLLQYFVLLHNDLRAKIAKRLATEEVIKQLKLVHAQELVNYSGNEWVAAKRAQAAEIRAVRDGKMDIIDRRSWAFPYLPEALHRLNQPVLKNTPYNLRRFSETPVPRRAINLIKNALLERDWEIKPIVDEAEIDPDLELRIRIATETLKRPNNEDSFHDFLEAVLEDVIIGGYGCIEPRITPYYQRPFKLWAVDGSTIRRFMDWTESTPDRPKWAQMTGLKGERGIVTFLDTELIYIRDNVRSNTPFGLGKLEVGFNAVNAFLGVQEMASRAGSDQVHKNWLWWEQTVQPGHFQTLRRHILNEHEGLQKISLMSGLKKPDIIDVKSVLPEDLLLEWQQFLIEIIADAFDMSPQALGMVQKGGARSTNMQVLADADFRSSVLPMAHRIEEAFTRFLIHGILGWTDLEFSFIGLEDPDAITRTMLQQRQYAMNAITPDEIRKANGQPPLKAGWGQLTMTQMQILLLRAQASLMPKGGAGGGMGSSSGMSGPGGMKQLGSGGGTGYSQGGFGMGTNVGSGGMGTTGGGGLGSGSGMGMQFAGEQIAQMSPGEIEMYQELGILPDNDAIWQYLQEQDQTSEPGILETLSDELRQFLHTERALEEESEIQPAKITPGMQRQQEERFDQGEHQESVAEAVINRRKAFGEPVTQQVRKNAQRGKYQKLPDGHYKPGKNNPYK